MHRMAVATSGAIGGAFGLAALGMELPISTGLILRSIADIASSEGENPKHLETQLACLTVFALGSPKDRRDDAAESGYFAARCWHSQARVSGGGEVHRPEGHRRQAAAPRSCD